MRALTMDEVEVVGGGRSQQGSEAVMSANSGDVGSVGGGLGGSVVNLENISHIDIYGYRPNPYTLDGRFGEIFNGPSPWMFPDMPLVSGGSPNPNNESSVNNGVAGSYHVYDATVASALAYWRPAYDGGWLSFINWNAATSATATLIPAFDEAGKYVGNASYTTYFHLDGTMTVQAGSIPNRDNNPRDIIASDFAIRHGAIGTDGGFAIFPDSQTGLDAGLALLKIRDAAQFQGQASLGNLVADQSPPVNQYGQVINETAKMIVDIMKMSGLNSGDIFSDLSDQQQRSFNYYYAIREGWKP